MTVAHESRPPNTVDAALIQSEKLSALGRMVTAIAHEINNPLTTILGQAQLLLGASDVSPRFRERLVMVSDEAFRAARIVHNLLTFARHSTPERRPCALEETLRWVLELTRHQLKQGGIELVTDFDTCPAVWVDENQIRQVLLNLVQNAQQAMSEAPPPRVLTVRLAEAEERVRIEVRDTGPGIAPTALAHIFDPFFTTKRSGEGTGLGLWVSLNIVEQHGGQLVAENDPERGAVFVLTLPYRKHAR
jgi:two-component system NtrC family sensor kinase